MRSIARGSVSRALSPFPSSSPLSLPRTDDEILNEGLDTTPGGTVKHKGVEFDASSSKFAHFAKGVTDVLESDFDAAINSNDGDNRPGGPGGVDALGETGGMVRFGSMEGDITAIKNFDGKNNESKDDSLQAFLNDDSDSSNSDDEESEVSERKQEHD